MLLVVVAVVLAVLVLSELLVRFHDWNRLQSCAMAGGRNCAGAPTSLSR